MAKMDLLVEPRLTTSNMEGKSWSSERQSLLSGKLVSVYRLVMMRGLEISDVACDGLDAGLPAGSRDGSATEPNGILVG